MVGGVKLYCNLWKDRLPGRLVLQKAVATIIDRPKIYSSFRGGYSRLLRLDWHVVPFEDILPRASNGLRRFADKY